MKRLFTVALIAMSFTFVSCSEEEVPEVNETVIEEVQEPQYMEMEIIYMPLVTVEPEVICCDGGTSGLYEGMTDICYGDNAVSNTMTQENWVNWMEGIGCDCD